MASPSAAAQNKEPAGKGDLVNLPPPTAPDLPPVVTTQAQMASSSIAKPRNGFAREDHDGSVLDHHHVIPGPGLIFSRPMTEMGQFDSATEGGRSVLIDGSRLQTKPTGKSHYSMSSNAPPSLPAKSVDRQGPGGTEGLVNTKGRTDATSVPAEDQKGNKDTGYAKYQPDYTTKHRETKHHDSEKVLEKLSRACQERGFNPKFQIWTTYEGTFKCTVNLHGRIIRDRLEYSTAEAAKQAVASIALPIVRNMRRTNKPAEFGAKTGPGRTRSRRPHADVPSPASIKRANSYRHKSLDRYGQRASSPSYGYRDSRRDDHREYYSGHPAHTSPEFPSQPPMATPLLIESGDRGRAPQAPEKAYWTPRSVPEPQTYNPPTRRHYVEAERPQQDDKRSQYDDERSRYNDQRSLMRHAKSLYGNLNGPSEAIMADPLASQAYLQGLAFGSQLHNLSSHRSAHDRSRERSPVPFRGFKRDRSPLRRRNSEAK